MNNNIEAMLKKADTGISAYLQHVLKIGKIDNQLFELAQKNTLPNLKEWLSDPKIDELSPHLKGAIIENIEKVTFIIRIIRLIVN